MSMLHSGFSLWLLAEWPPEPGHPEASKRAGRPRSRLRRHRITSSQSTNRACRYRASRAYVIGKLRAVPRSLRRSRDDTMITAHIATGQGETTGRLFPPFDERPVL